MPVLKDSLRHAIQDVLWQLDNLPTATPTALGEMIGCTAAYALQHELATPELINTAEAFMSNAIPGQVATLKTNVMVDLETLGTKPGCKVMSIGAVVFSPQGVHCPERNPLVAPNNLHTFHRIIARDGQGTLTEDPDTVAWWAKQSREAYDRLFGAQVDNVPLHMALAHFANWLNGLGGEVLVWGNGADFDNPILAAAYAAHGQPQPWGAWNGRCYRSLKGLRPGIKLRRTGTHHDALDDAISQAAHAAELLNDIGGWETARAKA